MANFNGVSAARAAYEAAIAARTEAGKQDLTDAGNRAAYREAYDAAARAFEAYKKARRDDARGEDAAYTAQARAADQVQILAAFAAYKKARAAAAV